MTVAEQPQRPWLLTGAVGYDPWLHLAELEGVTLTWHDIPGYFGFTDYETATISLRRGLTRAEQRSTLAHELVHIERGPVHGPSTSAPSMIEEQIVDQTAALRLIPAFALQELPELVSRHGRLAACDFLGVDDTLLDVALAAVTGARDDLGQGAS